MCLSITMLPHLSCRRSLSLSLPQVVQRLGPHRASVRCIDWCHTSGRLAVGTSDDSVTTYVPGDALEQPRWIPSGSFATQQGVALRTVTWACAPGHRPTLWVGGETLALWTLDPSGHWRPSWERSLACGVELMASDPGGRLLATAGSDDGFVKVWYSWQREPREREPREREPGAASSSTHGALQPFAAAAAATTQPELHFCYLRHPRALVSFEWRAPGEVPARGRTREPTVLMSLCRDGLPRLWALAHPEGLRNEQPHLFLCATLRLNDSSVPAMLPPSTEAPGSPGVRASGSVQLAMWLRPTSRLQIVGTDALGGAPSPLASCSKALSPRFGAVPSLRPSLGEQHDYALGILSDGSLVTWLVMGLAASPRASPKLMVWANLRRVLPPVGRFLSVAAFGHLEPSAQGAAAAADGELPSAVSLVMHSLGRAPHELREGLGDELSGGHGVAPAADCSTERADALELASIDLDRGAVGGSRVRRRVLCGHGAADAVHTLVAHPSLPLVASIDASGRLCVWESPCLGEQETCSDVDAQLNRAPPHRSSCTWHSVPSPTGGGLQCTLSARACSQVALWAPQVGGRLGGVLPAALLVLGNSEMRVFTRARKGTTLGWDQARPVALPDAGGWLCAHAFLPPPACALRTPFKTASASGSASVGGRLGSVSGFALGANGSQLVLWSLGLGAQPSAENAAAADEASGDAASGDAASSAVWTVSVLAQLSLAPLDSGVGTLGAWPLPTLPGAPRLPGGQSGAIATAHSDGELCFWHISSGAREAHLGEGDFEASLLAKCSPWSAPPLPLLSCTMAVQRGLGSRLALVCSTVSASHMCILEYESTLAFPIVEFESELAAGGVAAGGIDTVLTTSPPSCCWFALDCATQMLAVLSGDAVEVWAQPRAVCFQGQRVPWSLVTRLPLASHGESLRSLCVLRGTGSLFVAAGPCVRVCSEDLISVATRALDGQPSADALSAVGGDGGGQSAPPSIQPLIYWHPIVLMEQLLAGKDACVDVTLRHALQLLRDPSSCSVLSLASCCKPPIHAAARERPGAATSTLTATRTGDPFAPTGAEDIFAPTGVEDIFAPTGVEDIFAPARAEDLFAPSGMADGMSAPAGTERALPTPAREQQPASAPQSATRFGAQPHTLKEVVSEMLTYSASSLSSSLSLSVADAHSLRRVLSKMERAAELKSALDPCGSRFVLRVLDGGAPADEAPSDEAPSLSVTSTDVAWALQSDCASTLLEVCLGRVTHRGWSSLRALGVGFWMPQGATLRAAIEAAAKIQFGRKRDPHDCALLYVALDKKGALQVLCKAVQDKKLADFLSNDFGVERWRSAALKNAFSLLSKQSFELAAAFLILGGDVSAAVKVCSRQMGDLQLALVICRLAGDGELLRSTLHDELLPYSQERSDPWLGCVAHLLLQQHSHAFAALADAASTRQAPPTPPAAAASPTRARCGLRQPEDSSFEPCCVGFLSTLAKVPQLRNHKLETPQPLLDSLAYAFSRSGCELMALDASAGAADVQAADAQAADAQAAARGGHVRVGRAARVLCQFAEHLLGGSLSHPDIFGSLRAGAALEQRTAQLLEEIDTFREHFDLGSDALAWALVEQGSSLQRPQSLAAAFWALYALQLWRECIELLHQSCGAVMAILWRRLPDEVPDESCRQLLYRAAFLASALPLGLGAHGNMDQIIAVARLALFAVAWRTRDFETLRAMLDRSAHISTGELARRALERSADGPTLTQGADAVGRRQTDGLDRPIPSDAASYAWSRLLRDALLTLAASGSMHLEEPPPERSMAHSDQSRPAPLFIRTARYGGVAHEAIRALLSQWLSLVEARVRRLVSQVAASAFPLDGVALLSQLHPNANADAIRSVWASTAAATRPAMDAAAAGEHSPSAAPLARGPPAEPSTGAPPLPGAPPLHLVPSEGRCRLSTSPGDPPADASPPRLSTPTSLLHRKGEFVRAVCVNALNSFQLAVALSRGVHQLELVAPDSRAASPLSSAPLSPAATDHGRLLESSSQWLTWGIGVRNASFPYMSALDPTALDSPRGVPAGGVSVHQSSGSDLTARCLCSHPKLPLYLAGGDGVVQCWQFGQTVQGQGLHDHMRAQYELGGGNTAANLCFSPCGEQFASLDLGGRLALWNFHSGLERALPLWQHQCHPRRGADLTFVDSSVLLASVGSPSSRGGALCVWDVLLPPAQAMVASCSAHAEGGTVVRYSAADRSLISGGQKGEISIYDLRQQRIRTQWAAHALAVRSLALDESAAATSFYSASTDGDIKLWGVGAPGGQSGHSGGTRDGAEMPPRMAGHWPRAHEPHTMLHPLAGTTLGRTYGVNWMVRDGASRLLTAGADGKLNLWLVLPTSVKR